MKTRKITILATFLAISLSFVFLFATKDLPVSVSTAVAEKNAVESGSFKTATLKARSAYVFDISAGRAIFKKNSSAQLPLASLTKIMTAIVVKEKAPEGLRVRIPRKAILQEGDSGLLTGEWWKVSNLTDAMLIASLNDAAFALSMTALGGGNGDGSWRDFVKLMNKKAEEMNLNQTYFLNPTGLDVSSNTPGAYGSAQDVAKMLLYVLKKHPELLEATAYKTLKVNSHFFKNTDKLVGDIPLLVAGKTGFSDLAGGNLAIVVDVGFEHPVVIVVLGSSEEGRFRDVKTLYEETLQYFKSS